MVHCGRQAVHATPPGNSTKPSMEGRERGIEGHIPEGWVTPSSESRARLDEPLLPSGQSHYRGQGKVNLGSNRPLDWGMVRSDHADPRSSGVRYGMDQRKAQTELMERRVECVREQGRDSASQEVFALHSVRPLSWAGRGEGRSGQLRVAPVCCDSRATVVGHTCSGRTQFVWMRREGKGNG